MNESSTKAGGNWGALVIFVLLVAAIAGASSQFEPGVWYDAALKPDWTPPPSLFGPVWAFLYATMAIAAWRVWVKSDGSVRRNAITFWAIQLLLNGLWSWLFFGLHRIGWALGEMAILLIMIVLTLRLFLRIDNLAGLLLVPYVLWVSFAWALNYAIWSMNGGGFS